MTRIVAGRAGGRRLATPRGDATRPTSDRVREALFSTLVSLLGDVDGLRFLDLYAGSGAVGLEAWSRGATATLVESDRRTAGVVAANVRELGAGAEVRVVTAAVATFLERGPVEGAVFDVVFADPPYPLPEAAVAADLAALVAHGWLAPDAAVVVERSSRSPEPTWPDGLERELSRRYGETTLWYGHAP
ncbi:16S rRNA (guanine(966)-N(2))-methyltransferase RsmD [Nocardioides zeae]|uniref:16S rRNA (Guanine(966)-N(2))-methyltransferase RsmD n=1 Tax=Nocardioides imazamoxiresistens TaxID=3231893 RepID=A0ABU3PXD2_9ACTN|nr:16S rRNA (guanine(966)-N(2))-methyltransferase RsmD [Nocardioides zeae]MDT9593905.1 16S rRNA (guanine(966)-N(2))-methyltransferase RsmD [Nocardioides zeae]